MRPLRPRERHGCDGSGGWESRLYLDLQALAVQVQAGPPMQPPAPITRSRSGAEPTARGCSSTLTWRGFAVAWPCH
jgi:hypothetical protein